jgi:hypothetical protein
MWVIPKGFPKSVERVGSRLYGFPCFPYSVISMACSSGIWLHRLFHERIVSDFRALHRHFVHYSRERTGTILVHGVTQ